MAEIDDHIGCAMSGLTADAKTLIDHARAETQVRSRHVPSTEQTVCRMCVCTYHPSDHQLAIRLKSCVHMYIYTTPTGLCLACKHACMCMDPSGTQEALC